MKSVKEHIQEVVSSFHIASSKTVNTSSLLWAFYIIAKFLKQHLHY